MDFNEYQKLAQRTSSTITASDKLENGLMGLNGESGEAIDVLKKYLFQGHELDRTKLKEELSDILWYMAETATGLNLELESVARYNIEKLKTRYPDGFDTEKSINRAGR